jgi:hypothetical protein
MGRIGSARGRPLLVGLATLALAGVGLALPTEAAPAPSATPVTLTSGTAMKSEWVVKNTDSTSNGLPQGGTSATTPGLGVDDATYDVTGASSGDAFDYGLLFFVNNHQVIAPTNWDVQTDPADNTLNRILTSGPVAVGGVNATVEYRALPTQQVLRSLVSLSNAGTSAMTVPVTVATNNGSDGGTVIMGSSSGDTAFTDADRWLVTSDSATTPSDPVNTHVLGGPGAVTAPPTGTSTTVFDNSGTQGVLATYNVTIPAGATRALMFFNELSGTNAVALSAASRFNTNPAVDNELLIGLSDAQRASIVNWRLTQTQPDGWISKASWLPYIGNNIYNTTAKGQTVRKKAHRGSLRSFVVRVYNDGDVRAAFTANATSSAHKLRVRYYAGTVNVTSALRSASGLSFTLSPGQYKQFRVKMLVGRHAPIGARKFAKVTATGTGSGVILKDAVRAVVVVRR